MPRKSNYSFILCITFGYGRRERERFSSHSLIDFLHLGGSVGISTCDHFLLGIREIHHFHRCGIHIDIADHANVLWAIVCLSTVGDRLLTTFYDSELPTYLDGFL